MTGLIHNISVNTLNVDGINLPIKRQRLAVWMRKYDPTKSVHCLQETHFKCNTIDRLKIKGWKKDISCKHKKESRSG